MLVPSYLGTKQMAHVTLLAMMVCLVVAGGVGAAPVPAGSEFQINTYTTGSQDDPDVCTDADGNFVVVWNGYEVGVRGRRFNAAGTALTGEFIVTASPGDRAHIACQPDGGFVVTWGGAATYSRDGTTRAARRSARRSWSTISRPAVSMSQRLR